jgi:hypothetical protein
MWCYWNYVTERYVGFIVRSSKSRKNPYASFARRIRDIAQNTAIKVKYHLQQELDLSDRRDELQRGRHFAECELLKLGSSLPSTHCVPWAPRQRLCPCAELCREPEADPVAMTAARGCTTVPPCAEPLRRRRPQALPPSRHAPRQICPKLSAASASSGITTKPPCPVCYG